LQTSGEDLQKMLTQNEAKISALQKELNQARIQLTEGKISTRAPKTFGVEPTVVTTPASASSLNLRSQPAELSPEQVEVILKRYDFYCREHDWSKGWSNPQGKGIDNKFELRQNGMVIFDHVTGLRWQQSGSPNRMTYANAEKYISDLNNHRFADYNDWRLPTLEEAMSLMELEKKHGGLYIDPVFDQTQQWIWTADKESAGWTWVVGFHYGYCNLVRVDDDIYVRAVR
ncbi:MAG: DUF1566 domain-containing protein, partial [bacterium]